MYSNKVTSGKECLPYRVTLGDFMRFFYENERYRIDPRVAEGFLASAYGPCRFGKYAIEHVRILRELGFDFPIRTTVSNNGYHDLNLGSGFERLAWRGIVAVDYLEKLLWRTRPYEKTSGAAEALFDEYLARIADLVSRKEPLEETLRDATIKFKNLINPDIPRKPLVGINGEIFLRSNKFSNSNLVQECEKVGLEVMVSPIGEWLKYITYRNIEDGVRDRDLKRIITGNIRKYLLEKDERLIVSNFIEMIEEDEPTTKELLHYSRQYLSPKCGSEAVLSIGAGIEWIQNPRFAGVISVMPHGCMPGGIVAAMSEKFSARYGKPWISLTYDGFLETNNQAKINNFAEILKFTSKNKT